MIAFFATTTLIHTKTVILVFYRLNSAHTYSYSAWIMFPVLLHLFVACSLVYEQSGTLFFSYQSYKQQCCLYISALVPLSAALWQLIYVQNCQRHTEELWSKLPVIMMVNLWFSQCVQFSRKFASYSTTFFWPCAMCPKCYCKVIWANVKVRKREWVILLETCFFFLLFQIALLLSGLFLTLSLIFPKAVDWFMIFFFQYTSGN